MISIIVPVYKVETYLEQCLDSIRLQTYRDVEILLIDDGSPDRCGEICEQYAATDSRIRVFHTENRGLSAARNLGIIHARGDYLGFVDSDDWIEPNMYECLLCAAEVSDADIAVCGRYWEYEGTRESFHPTNATLCRDEAIKALVKSEIRNGVWDKLYRRTCFERIRFPEGRVYEDVATIYRVFLQAKKIVCLAQPLYHYRVRKGSITDNNDFRFIMDLFIAEKEKFENIALVSPYNKDKEILDALLCRCTSAIIRVWDSYIYIPAKAKKANYQKMKEISRFVRTYYPFFGPRGWSVGRRGFLILCRYTSGWFFIIIGLMLRKNISSICRKWKTS